VPRNVVQVSAYYPPHLGGQENVVQGLAESLALRGWHSEVVTSNQGAPAGRISEQGVVVTRLRSGEFGHTAVMPALLPWLVRRATEAPIFHVHIGQAFVPEMIRLASRLRGFPYVVQLHTDLRPSGPLGFLIPAYRQAVLGSVLCGASSVLVMSPDYELILRKDYRYEGTVSLVRNGISAEWFKGPERRSNHVRGGPLRLLYVGRLAFPKNCAALVDAMGQLSRGSAYLTVIGTGPEARDLRRRVMDRDLADFVSFTGPLNRTAIIKRMTQADAVIIPSLYESSPLVLLESLATGTPVISANVVGLREQAPGCTLQCEPTPPSIAAAIRHLGTMSPTALTEMTSRGRMAAGLHRWPDVCSDYEAVYLDVSRSA
jgi:glycosyltransferase involved in cell wall biosynthesis